jgi:uracil-DNA glycosylase
MATLLANSVLYRHLVQTFPKQAWLPLIQDEQYWSCCVLSFDQRSPGESAANLLSEFFWDKSFPMSSLTILNREIVACRRCPRLVDYRERIAREKRRAYMDCEYWGKPVPGFGDPDARVLVVGLAPGAHGSNRTGRMFTGDSSGNFMYPVLYATGFASQPDAKRAGDGLELRDLYITAAVRCAPPGNKPSPGEISNCSEFFDREVALLKRVCVFVGLGRIGFNAVLEHLKRRGLLERKSVYIFAHGAEYELPDGRILVASYHPSNQNTQTGKLTEEMFRDVFVRVRELANGVNVRTVSDAPPSK